MTKRNPGFHRQRKGFHIPKLPPKPSHVRDLEEGEHIGAGCCQMAPVRPRDYLQKETGTTDVDFNQQNLTELIKA